MSNFSKMSDAFSAGPAASPFAVDTWRRFNDSRYRCHLLSVQPKLTKRDMRLHQAITGVDGHGVQPTLAYGCHAQTRQLISKAAERLFVRLRAENPSKTLVFGTIIHAPWVTDDIAPIIELRSIREHLSRCLRYLGMDTILFVEFDQFEKRYADGSHAISPHAHFIGLASGGYRKKVRALRASRRLMAPLGLKSIKVRKVGESDADVGMVANYCVKAFTRTKRCSPSKLKPGGFKLRTNDATDRAVARMTEILSYLKLTDLIVTHGAGWGWRREVLATLGQRSTDDRCSDAALNAFWTRYWALLGRPDFRRPDVQR